MSFLAPLYLLGLGALALPVLLHLARQTPREKIVFSSLQFLYALPPRSTRRRRIEHWLLLCCRVLLLAVLALAFARPFFPRGVAGNDAQANIRAVVVLVDVSASMRRGEAWSHACQRLAQVLSEFNRQDQVQVLTFGSNTRTILAPAEWAEGGIALVRQRMASVAPTWEATDLGNALLQAANLSLENHEDHEASGKSAEVVPTNRREVVVISDLQQGCNLTALERQNWPSSLPVRWERIEVANPTNAGLEMVVLANGVETGHAPKNKETGKHLPEPPRVRVYNAADSQRERFRVVWQDSTTGAVLGSAVEVYVPAGRSRQVRAPKLPPDRAADSARIQLVLLDDDHAFDNSFTPLLPQARTCKVFYVGGDSPADARRPRYYVDRALAPAGARRFEIGSISPNTPDAEVVFAGARLAVVAEPLADECADALRQFLHAGGTVLLTLTSPAMGATLARLADVPQVICREAPVADFALLQELDFAHPLLAPFGDARFSDFSKIYFWHYRHLEMDNLPQARVLARFDTGSPALLEIPRGRGLLVVLAAGWHPEDSQLAVSSKFAPLLHRLWERSEGGERRQSYPVGASVPLPPARRVRGPDGTWHDLAGADSFHATDRPGIYETEPRHFPSVGFSAAGADARGASSPGAVVAAASAIDAENAAPGGWRFAVYLDPNESKTAPLTLEELQRWVPVDTKFFGDTADQADSRENPFAQGRALRWEREQALWRGLLLGAIAVLLVEIGLAGVLSKQRVER